MRFLLPGRHLVLLAVLLACLLPLVLAGPQTIPRVQPQSRFHDWSTRHALYPRFGTMAALEAARTDPRALFRWRETEQREIAARRTRWLELQPGLLQSSARHWPRRLPPGDFAEAAAFNADWSINLGTTGTAPAMYPAKFTFDTTAAVTTTNCTYDSINHIVHDYVVFPVNATGGAAQPNIVAFENLYSGTAGGNGICNRTATANDNGVSATVLWSYNVHAIVAGAAVPTSPVLSLDGTKVAFVESAAGNPAHFHVLAWKSGDGRAANLQNALAPVAITAFSGTAPAADSGTATDAAFGATTDTLSSPFVDYVRDLAYVGNDAGVVFRFKNVFCTTASCGTAAPSLDSTWGTSGALTIGGTCTGASGRLTGPILDFVTLNVYVGCADGKLYSISQTGTIKSLVVGDGVASKTFGAIVDPPLVDGVNAFVYAVSGSANAGANGVLVQAKIDFSSSVAVPIGAGNQCNIHSPALNNAYFTSPTSAGSLIVIGGDTGTVGPCTAAGATGGKAVLYGATFGAGGVLNAGAPANSLTSGNSVGSEYAPMGELFNSNIGTGQDTLFVSLLRNNSNGFNNLYTFNITAGWNATIQKNILEGLGISGMVVDNDSTSAQASSIYFNSLNQNATCSSPQTGANTNGCAVKLTQANLN
jgi:hypothetical protein